MSLFGPWTCRWLTAVSVIDAVDGSSTRDVSAMDVGAAGCGHSLANKIARMAWAIMAKGERYRKPAALAA
jgi:hypothetical protein